MGSEIEILTQNINMLKEHVAKVNGESLKQLNGLRSDNLKEN